jgi:hypothetical protein
LMKTSRSGWQMIMGSPFGCAEIATPRVQRQPRA